MQNLHAVASSGLVPPQLSHAIMLESEGPFPLWGQGALYRSAVLIISFAIPIRSSDKFLPHAVGCGGIISENTTSSFDTKAMQKCDLPG